MEDFVYRFLLQSGYPRAAIVTDLHLLPLVARNDGLQATDELERPDFAIVDPLTIERLAVISVRGAIDEEGIRRAAAELGVYALRFGGRSIQGFLVRVDVEAEDPQVRVQFYRVWPGESLEPVSARAFPDLDSLRTLLRLHERSGVAPTLGFLASSDAQVVCDDKIDAVGAPGQRNATARARSRAGRPGALAWLPGLVLVLLAIADWYLEATRGQSLLNTVQAVLAVGAAALLLWPALCRRHDT